MTLEEQLSLNSNGGVYYEGTRVTPTEDPILFVGLGGTGIDALLCVKNEVQTRMPLPKGPNGQILSTSPNNIAFIAVDTDKETLKKTYGVAGFEKSGDEFINLTVDGLPNVISAVVERHINEPEWNWFDKDLTSHGGLDGANGIRQIGRFMLFQKINEVRKRFLTTIEKTVKAASGNSLKIFVLTGVGGGTGSGTFLDIAYILRTLGLEKTPNVQVHGYVFTPDLNKGNGGDDSSMYRNGFAALKELDYWMSASEHKQSFIQKYNSEFTVNSQARPFDFCHIITAQDAQHNLVTYREAMNAVGSNLFAYIVSEQVSADGNTALKEMYDNISGHIVMANKPYPANYNYLSVGSSKIEIPYTQITTLVATRVFQKLNPIFQKAPDRDTFNRDLFALELTHDHLWGFVHRDIIPNPITGNKFSYGDIWPSNAPYQKAYQWLNGHAQQLIRKNKSNLASICEGKLREYITKLIKDEKLGPCYASRMIMSNTSFCLIKTLEGYRDDCRERVSGTAAKAPGLKNQMEQAFIGGKNAGLLGRSNAAKEYIEALEAWLNNEYGYWAYYDLADGLDEVIARFRKYYDRVMKNLQDSLCMLPGVFEANLNKIKVDEQEAQKSPERAKNYLIRPLEFEKKFAQTLNKKVEVSARAFLNDLAENLPKWVGIQLDDIDSDIMDNTDISGFIAQFINDNFNETLTMNMENLLLDKVIAGTNSDEYLRTTLDQLRDGAIPLYHMDVTYSGLDIKAFSLISVPNDCPKIFAVANRSGHPREERPKLSSERSKLQWVKVMAGMPLFAFPEVSKMEQKYEIAMKTSRETRKGVHLRWEWREQLPSPLPESTWPDTAANTPEKEFAQNYNAKARAAFNKCVNGNVIRIASNGEYAELYIADESKFAGVELRGTINEKKEQLEMMRRSLWADTSTAIQLNPFGTVAGDNLMNRICENNLRFYNIVSAMEKQAEILEKFDSLLGEFVNVEFYVKAIFADLIYKQGFDYKFKRSELDYSPIKLFDAMEQTSYLDYDIFKAFSASLDNSIKENIKVQFDRTRRNLIGADGNFNQSAVDTIKAKMAGVKDRCTVAFSAVTSKMDFTPLEQRTGLEKIADFYAKALELTEDINRSLS